MGYERKRQIKDSFKDFGLGGGKSCHPLSWAGWREGMGRGSVLDMLCMTRPTDGLGRALA